MTVRILSSPTTRHDLASIAENQFGDMVKAVIDVLVTLLVLE